MKFLKNAVTVIVLMLLAALLVVSKLWQSAAHRDKWFDWSYIFSWPNIKQSLIVASIALVTVLIYLLGEYLMNKYPDDDQK